jgi:hypothetical protein
VKKDQTCKRKLTQAYFDALRAHPVRWFAGRYDISSKNTVQAARKSGLISPGTFQKLEKYLRKYDPAGPGWEGLEVVGGQPARPLKSSHEDAQIAVPVSLQDLLNRRATAQQVYAATGDLYHRHSSPYAALRLARHPDLVDHARTWEWEDRCQHIATVVHFARRTGKAENVRDVLRDDVMPLLLERALPREKSWPTWLVYLAGELLDLLNEYDFPNAADSQVIGMLLDHLCRQLQIKAKENLLPYDLNVPIFAAFSCALDRRKTKDSENLLALAGILRGASAANHQCALGMRLLESHLAPGRTRKLPTTFASLEHQLERAVAGLVNGARPDAGFDLSLIAFRSAACHLIVAARLLHRDEEARVSKRIAELSNQFLHHRRLKTTRTLPRVRLSLRMRELTENRALPHVLNGLIQFDNSSNEPLAPILLDVTKRLLQHAQFR